MTLRSIKARIAIVTLAVSMLVPLGLVQAGWSYWEYPPPYPGTDVPIQTYWTGWDTHRYAKYSPYGIWFQKTDGPVMRARWIYCGFPPSGGTSSGGPKKSVSNSDPAPGVFLRDNGIGGYLDFCLAFVSDSGSSDAFTGALNWDGDFAP